MQTSKAISFHFSSGHRLLYISIFGSPGHPFGLRAVFIKFMGGFYSRMVGLALHGFLNGCCCRLFYLITVNLFL